MLDRGRTRRWIWVGLLLGATACGPDLEPPGRHAQATASSTRTPVPTTAPVAAPSAGLYEVSGVVEDASGKELRALAGRWILTESAPLYRSLFDLRTEVVTRDGVLRAERVGTASAIRGDDGMLVGVAESRLLFSAFDGLPPRYPFGPGRVGELVTATFRMQRETGGHFRIELETAPLPGDEWAAERAILRAVRVSGLPRQ